MASFFVDDDGRFAIRGAIFCPPLTPEEVPFRVTFQYMSYEHDMIHELLPIHRIAKNFPCILFSMMCERLPVVVRKLF